MKWKRTNIITSSGEHDAVAPEVISASRSTDIPAFHAEWFVRRLRAGYVKWVNPFNQQPQYISFENAKVIVFWSKNPEPIVKHLPEIEKLGITYYFQYTVNDYETEGFEPNVPPLNDRLETFRRLSDMLGQERVIWRFDPLILTNLTCVGTLLSKLQSVGDKLHPYTRRLIFSFADISNYSKVQRNLMKAGIVYQDFTDDEIHEISAHIGQLCRTWGLNVFTCGERIDLSRHGIAKGKCIDDQLLLDMTGNDSDIMALFGYNKSAQPGLFDISSRRRLKDPGQREACGCVFSKDIGQYNTCSHMCVYCYANSSPELVKKISPNAHWAAILSRVSGRSYIIG